MSPEDTPLEPTDQTDRGPRSGMIAYTVMLGIGVVLVLAAAVTTFLAVRAEWQTADAEADTRSAEEDLSDTNADTADLVARQADIQAAAAQQSALRAQVVEAWNAVAGANDAALAAATRAVDLFNDGDVVQARQILDTEAGGALETAEQDLEALRDEAKTLEAAVDELRGLLADAGQP
ncbi:MAG: hypothetical protein R3A49_08055 [Acidimicrobiia bacterium]